jgi:hypothetical protein
MMCEGLFLTGLAVNLSFPNSLFGQYAIRKSLFAYTSAASLKNEKIYIYAPGFMGSNIPCQKFRSVFVKGNGNLGCE